MNSHDLLERRAERGVPRGAAHVWAGARAASGSSSTVVRGGSAILFRVAMAVWVLGLVVVGWEASTRTETSRAVTGETAQDEPAATESDEPLPAPLLVDGGRLKRNPPGVNRPFDPDFDGDDIFDRIFPTTVRSELPSEPESPATTVIYAEATAPFEGPILGLELLAGGGFRPWGVNVDKDQLRDLTEDLELVNGDWSVARGAGIVEVARFRDDPFNSLKFGWQFDFELPGNDEITIQAEAAGADRTTNEWIWIARFASHDRTGVTARPVEVLGHDGYLIDGGDRKGDDGVVRLSDGFVYRMSASRLEDNTSFGRDSVQAIERLRIADRSEWIDAIHESVSTSAGEWIAGVLGLLVLAGLTISIIFFLTRRSTKPATLAAASILAWIFLAGSPTYLGTTGLTTLGLGLAWWLHRGVVSGRDDHEGVVVEQR